MQNEHLKENSLEEKNENHETEETQSVKEEEVKKEDVQEEKEIDKEIEKEPNNAEELEQKPSEDLGKTENKTNDNGIFFIHFLFDELRRNRNYKDRGRKISWRCSERRRRRSI